MVKKKNTVQTILLKVGIVVGVVAVLLAALLFGSYLGPLSFAVPFLILGGCYGAYYLITSLNVEYEYAVTNGEMDIDKIIAQRKRKRLLSVNCREVEAFGRYQAQEHQGKGYQKTVIACDHPDSSELWYCIARLKDSGRTLVVFNANQKMLDGIKPFLPRPIMHEAFRVGG